MNDFHSRLNISMAIAIIAFNFVSGENSIQTKHERFPQKGACRPNAHAQHDLLHPTTGQRF